MTTASKEYDFQKVEKVVRQLRAFFAQPSLPTISTLQNHSLRERSTSKSLWLSQSTLPSPENIVCNVLDSGIQSLSRDGRVPLQLPDPIAVDLEWVGCRQNAQTGTDETYLSEKEKYLNLMKEVSSNVTILYVHGGGF